MIKKITIKDLIKQTKKEVYFMDKKYLNDKKNNFIFKKKSEIPNWKIIDWKENETEFFIDVWLKTRKKFKKLKELNNNSLCDLKKAVKKIIEVKQVDYLQK